MTGYKRITGKTAITKAEVFNYMDETKTKLFTIQGLADEYECEFRSIQNILHNLRIEGKIDRHIEKDKDKSFRFAVVISPDKIQPYVMAASKSTSENKGQLKKRKGQLLSSKEIRSMFAAHYNNMAKLEDSVMAIIDRSEMTEKEMEKIRKFLKP